MDQALLIRLYHEQALSVDKLPYTDEFNAIVNDYNRRHPNDGSSHRDIYRMLVNFRKNGKLIRKTDRNIAQKRLA